MLAEAFVCGVSLGLCRSDCDKESVSSFPKLKGRIFLRNLEHKRDRHACRGRHRHSRWLS